MTSSGRQFFFFFIFYKLESQALPNAELHVFF